MRLIYILKELIIGFMQGFSTDLWVKITTVNPQCIYYFGPFQTHGEARLACPGYMEDIESEGSQGIEVMIKRCQPKVLTVFNE